MARDIGESMIDVNEIKKMINLFFWPVKGSRDILREVGYAFRTEFYDEAVHSEREHYMHYISFEWYENRCDTLANSMAILFDIADKNKSEKILNYFLKKKLSTPYPIKVLNPPAWISSYIWNPKIDLYRYNIPSQMNVPFHYHNSGIWPYVGGFYVMSLLSAGKKKESKNELGKLVQANKIGKEREWEFNEWLHGKTGKPMGAALQAWSAAGFILAYKAVVEKNILF